MNISAPFIARPVATTLLTLAIALAGILGFSKLPVSPLPQVDFPTISVTATLPGASPNTVATSVAEPLERHLGQIAGVTEMTSQSGIGQARITLQFDISRDIDGAARDVEAAINAARADLPSNLPSNPIYRKVNPADAPILILALTSKTMTQGQMYDAASNILAQRLSQLSGIGNVIIGGSTLPAVRVELNPQALYKYGIGLEDVRAALASANANSPKGTIDDGNRRYQIYTNDQANVAADYAPLVIAYRNSAAVRLSDVADVQNSVQDVRNLGMANGEPSVLVILFRQPNANIIETIDNVRAELPHLEAAMPADMNVTVAIDRSTTIRASLHDTELTLVMAVILVTIVVYLFLRNIPATLIPSVAVPISILGTFGVMYLLGYSLDILSLMALTIATGFVVDDAIVVLENISRHIDDGVPHVRAAFRGAREVGFTVLSISLSLIAVFIPILLMGGILGRLFREFTVTLSIAILVSLAVSLTTTPMMCALLLRTRTAREMERGPNLFERLRNGYARTLTWGLRHSRLVLALFIATICLNVWLYIIVPKGFFPQQDTGRLIGSLQADQSISFQLMSKKLRQMMNIVREDPAVEYVVGYTGVGSGGGYAQINTGNVYVSLKPLSQRVGVEQVITRLRPKLAQVPGGRLYLAAVQDLRAGGRQSNAQYQYTLQSETVEDLYEWTPKLVDALEHNPVLTDVSSDQQQRGLETYLDIDRDTTARLGISPLQIDNTLYDAFGQRQVSVIYSAINQYHVVMEIDPRYTQYPNSLRDVYVSTSGQTPPGTLTTNAPAGNVTAATTNATLATAPALPPNALAVTTAPPPAYSATSASLPSSTTSSASGKSGSAATSAATSTASAATSASALAARNAFINALANTGHGPTSAGAAVSTAVETMIPLAAVSHYRPGHTPLSVNHQGLFVASTISFNLQPGKSLGEASAEINAAIARINMPSSIRGVLAGTAQLFQQSLGKEPILILTAIAAVYILLGVLYESYVHPITILSTLPSAGVGALLALMLFQTEFDIIGLIGVILLIGIVKKNAIMMVDFAIEAKRARDLNSYDAIFEACLLRFRPIMMTTAAAILGAIPLALSFGNGGEIRRPLGMAIVGGLLISQLLTLYTTPVLYLYLDRLSGWSMRARQRLLGLLPGAFGRRPAAGEA
ncbi:MAG TPA: efflux RND transporter permease subunit [Xanthobacteraceae bacterium]|nr:efflux RND transporter permease subunit [Xanthobacteraceae bacterium]